MALAMGSMAILTGIIFLGAVFKNSPNYTSKHTTKSRETIP
jgi:hypothetical protein